MAPNTEIAYFKLKDPKETLEGSGEAATTAQEIFDTIIAIDGVQRIYWGKAVEDPSIVRVFIEWESIEHHTKFQTSEAMGPFVQKFMTIFSETTLMAHSNLKDIVNTARDVYTSPASELLTVFFPAGYTTAQQDKFEADIHKLVNNIGEAKGFRAVAAGWGLEDDIPNLTKPETKGKAFFFLVGWDTIQDHMNVREGDAFKENIHLLRDAEDLQGFLNMHFHGKEVVRK